MKRMNKKGFTLIELLAVIIILGVLMIIAIPSVTTYIQNSRKSAYVDTSAAYVEAVRTRVNEGKDFRLFATDTLYMIPVGDKMYDKNHTDGTDGPFYVSCVSVESGGQSPFSDVWNYAFVGVTYNGNGYSYYYVGEDGAGQGLTFMPFKVLTDEGTGLVYSSTSDDAYTNANSTDATLYHTLMNTQLHDSLHNAYTAKVKNVFQTYTSTTAPTGVTNWTGITNDNAKILTALVNLNEARTANANLTDVTKVEFLGQCKS